MTLLPRPELFPEGLGLALQPVWPMSPRGLVTGARGRQGRSGEGAVALAVGGLRTASVRGFPRGAR